MTHNPPRLTRPQWTALARAVALAEAEYDDENNPDAARDIAVLKRAWDRMHDLRVAGLV